MAVPLDRCPECGATSEEGALEIKAYRWREDGIYNFGVRCKKCCFSTDSEVAYDDTSKESAVKSWNSIDREAKA